MTNVIVWDVTRYSLVEMYRLLPRVSITFHTQKIERACLSGMLINSYHSTWCSHPFEEAMVHCQQHENLKS
jgi:hypothetical protein